MVPVRVPRISGSTPAPSGGLSIKIASYPERMLLRSSPMAGDPSSSGAL